MVVLHSMVHYYLPKQFPEAYFPFRALDFTSHFRCYPNVLPLNHLVLPLGLPITFLFPTNLWLHTTCKPPKSSWKMFANHIRNNVLTETLMRTLFDVYQNKDLNNNNNAVNAKQYFTTVINFCISSKAKLDPKCRPRIRCPHINLYLHYSENIFDNGVINRLPNVAWTMGIAGLVWAKIYHVL